MLREPMAVPVPNGAGAACSTARLPRLWEGESVPVLAEGYVETEYFLSGWASTYSGPATGPVAVASDASRYVTRLLVRHPTSAADFSGRVVVEPFNTSFGVDRDALWARVGGLLQAEGDAWVGVTTRAMGAAELGKFDPVRYADIDFPANDLAWDALRDVGALIKSGGPRSPLGSLVVRRVYLGGYSQSAVDIATFAMAFQRHARLSDGSAMLRRLLPGCACRELCGHFIGSCMAAADGVSVDAGRRCAGDRGTTAERRRGILRAAWLRQASSTPARRRFAERTVTSQRDRYRLYELAGAPHVARLDGCEGSGSSFPTSAFVRAALRLLFEWAEDGLIPPRAARISLDKARAGIGGAGRSLRQSARRRAVTTPRRAAGAL